MNPTEFTQQFINALGLGSIYALVAIGLAMIFSILRLINFAHGEIIMLGAFAAYYFDRAGLPPVFVVILAIATTIAAGLLMELFAYRPLRGAPDVSLLLTSLAVSILLQTSGTMIFGAQPKRFPTPSAIQGQFVIAGIRISIVNLVTVGVAILLMAGLNYFVRNTVTGTSMRAAAENPVAARLMGINPNTVIVAAFIIGSALAGVAGILWGSRVGRIDPLMGFIPVLKAFVATVIGGFGSIPGAVIGAYIIGFGEVFLTSLLPDSLSGYRDAFVFGALILLLLFRPQGILGSPDPERI